MASYVPLKSVPRQTLQIVLGGQSCVLTVYQLDYGLFIDVQIGGNYVVAGVICVDRIKIVRSTYLGFVGDLTFVDTQGSSDPVYTGLGSRWQLVYLEAKDL